MLLLKLVAEKDSEVVYNYFPEQGEESGSVTVNKKTGEIADAQVASNDLHRRYLHHAVTKIVEFSEKGIFEDEVIVAWY